MSISSTRTHRLLFALALTGALLWPVNTGPFAGGHHDHDDDDGGDHGISDEVKLCLKSCDLFEEACPTTCGDICGSDVECTTLCLPSCSEFAGTCRTDCTGPVTPPDDDDDDGHHGGGHCDDDDDGHHGGGKKGGHHDDDDDGHHGGGKKGHHGKKGHDDDDN